jgi:hypothetical protein
MIFDEVVGPSRKFSRLAVTSALPISRPWALMASSRARERHASIVRKVFFISVSC